MLVCAQCRQEVTATDLGCPRCGSPHRAEVDERGAVVALSGDPQSTCTSCGEHAEQLLFRRYRRVVGMVILDTIHQATGYLCPDCRTRLFRRHMGLTLLLGWWGVIALLMRNPYAIAVNVKSLFAPPRNARKFGALTLDELAPRTD